MYRVEQGEPFRGRPVPGGPTAGEERDAPGGDRTSGRGSGGHSGTADPDAGAEPGGGGGPLVAPRLIHVP
ncbi:hypothetical protein GCM10023205_27870 [Yinghuangia aomiensis]|uniref:Uncharacterized protein n=1 Tax=Yinghuangia aomiensis TaxID=676205 RepID=A0ABP9H6V2_9ACTN